jgi:tRNA (guanine37-N1)-methyltransferase
VRIDVFTIFPGAYSGPLTESIIKRAQDEGLFEIQLHDIRDWAADRHRSVDDYPYGGGAGMVMMAPPIVDAVESILGDQVDDTPTLLPSPSGEPFTQRMAMELAQHARLAFICGRYEGIDARVSEILNAREVSIGDYVMTGGDLAASVMIDVIARLIPGVIDEESLAEESHTSGLLEYPQYTRPPVLRDRAVPDILLSGNHGKIAEWRRRQALERTLSRRPDLLSTAPLTDEERQLIARLQGADEGEPRPYSQARV